MHDIAYLSEVSRKHNSLLAHFTLLTGYFRPPATPCDPCGVLAVSCAVFNALYSVSGSCSRPRVYKFAFAGYKGDILLHEPQSASN